MSSKKNEFRLFNNGGIFVHGNDRRQWRATMKGGLASDIMLGFIFFFFSILFCYLLSSAWVNSPIYSSSSLQKWIFPTTSSKIIPLPPLPSSPLIPIKSTPKSISTLKSQFSYINLQPDYPQPKPKPKPKPRSIEYLLNCTTKNTNQTTTCPHNNYPMNHTLNPNINPGRPSTCPEYFRWIHEDLRPWKETGITRDMVERARRTAHFRVVILDGRVYVEKYRKSLQSRDKFTLWGILQLLRWYPGRLPDLELMFDCDDRPVIASRTFIRRPSPGPPPLFRYCSDQWSLDIVFPDWSFWGWAETNIKPWRNASKDIKEGKEKTKWKDRIPYAFWRGNPFVAPWRADLLKCNVSNKFDWNTRLFIQNWEKQAKVGYKESKLEDHCTHRYKIYIEGWAWSVSQKYILACDSMTLLVKPRFHEFFTRGLLPLQHYWPIRDNNKCMSLKFAVAWGNNHTDKAQAIGKGGSRYMEEDVRMEMVYDYMFHLLNEYSKLLRFKPTIPSKAVELCSDIMACQDHGIWKKFMEDSLVKSPRYDGTPCKMPPPYNPLELSDFLDRKANFTRQVEILEDQYWTKLNSKGLN